MIDLIRNDSQNTPVFIWSIENKELQIDSPVDSATQFGYNILHSFALTVKAPSQILYHTISFSPFLYTCYG